MDFEPRMDRAAGLWPAGPRQAPGDPLRPKLQAALDALHAAGIRKEAGRKPWVLERPERAVR